MFVNSNTYCLQKHKHFKTKHCEYICIVINVFGSFYSQKNTTTHPPCYFIPLIDCHNVYFIKQIRAQQKKKKKC